MKNSVCRNNIIALIYILLFASCEDMYNIFGEELKPSLSAHYLRPSKTEFGYSWSPNAYEEAFTIESFETPWAFSDVADWLTLTPASGNATTTVNLKANANTDADKDRSAIFYLKSNAPDWNYSRAMSISQAKASPTISISNKSVYFGGASEQQKVTISANCKWSASCSDSWISLSADYTSGILTISVSENHLTSYRNSNIYITYSTSKTTSIKVTQSPASITSSDYTLNYENIASKFEIEIESEIAWTSSVSDSWISVSPSNGNAGKTTVTIEVTPNTTISNRTGYVAIKTGSAERLQISIYQKGIYIEATESLTFKSIVESKTLSIQSNTDWVITGKPNWLSVSKEAGTGNDNITVTSTENHNTTSRSGEIIIGQPGLSIECKVSITQIGKTLSTNVSLLEFSDKASQQNFNITSDANWTSSKSVDWFTHNPISGYGDTTVNVAVEENTSTEERIGTINYSFADKTTFVNIHQLAKYMTIDNKSFDFDSKGGSHTIELSTNDEWTAEVEHQSSWLKLSKTSGTGNATITLTVDDNPSVNVRSTAIIIKTKYSQSVKILVSQKPRYLSISSTNILFFANGGNSEVVTIDTYGTYEIMADASWFTINKGIGNTFAVYATKNSSNDLRQGKITITLTDLKEGSLALELTVMQAGEGGSFILNGFPDDSNWNYIGSGSLLITIKGYTSDQNWDDSFGGSLTVKVSGYSTDSDWNINDSSSGSVSINTYGTDNNWSNSTNSNGTFSNTPYNSDLNWNN